MSVQLLLCEGLSFSVLSQVLWWGKFRASRGIATAVGKTLVPKELSSTLRALQKLQSFARFKFDIIAQHKTTDHRSEHGMCILTITFAQSNNVLINGHGSCVTAVV
jgi:hypothetical protein